MPARTAKLDLRLSPEAKRTLSEAAQVAHRSVSDFETLVERQHFELSAERWAAFMAALDAPPRPLPRLKRLFREPSPFETSEPG
jgi:uncharacterized protein (DUF1778 family)